MLIGQFNPAIAWELAPVDNNIVAVDNNMIPVEYRGVWKRHTRSGPAFDKIRSIASQVERITQDYLITGGSCLDAWRYDNLRNDIDIFIKANPDIPNLRNWIEGLGWIFLKDKKLEGDYGPVGLKLPDHLKPVRNTKDISNIDQFAVRHIGTVDVIIVDDLDQVIPSFDINLSKYFWNPRLGDIDDCFVKYPTEVALEKVSSPQNFPRHIERMQKYSKVTGFPMTCRIDNFSEAFV